MARAINVDRICDDPGYIYRDLNSISGGEVFKGLRVDVYHSTARYSDVHFFENRFACITAYPFTLPIIPGQQAGALGETLPRR